MNEKQMWGRHIVYLQMQFHSFLMIKGLNVIQFIMKFGYFGNGKKSRFACLLFQWTASTWFILNFLLTFRSIWCIFGASPVSAWTCTSFILFTFHFAYVVVCTCYIDRNGSAVISLRNGHRSWAIHCVLVVFGAAPENSFFTFTIPYITIVIQ